MVGILLFSKEAPMKTAPGTKLIKAAYVVAIGSPESLEDLPSANLPHIS